VYYTKANPITVWVTLYWATNISGISSTAIESSIKSALMPYINSQSIGISAKGQAIELVAIESVSSIVSKEFFTIVGLSVTYNGVPITPSSDFYLLPNVYDYMTIIESNITVLLD
jgi:hypothetical protein